MELRRALIALLLYESEGRPKEGLFHWFVLHNGVTLATWALAIFAWIPLLSLLYVIRSKKRDDQFRLLQWIDSQFNSAAMVSARRETGKKMQEEEPFRNLKQFPDTSALANRQLLWAGSVLMGRKETGY